MVVKKASHAVYDMTYHLICAPKYRKWVLRGDIQERVKSLFEEIAIANEFEIDTMEVAADHVHLFLSFPPRHSVSKVVGMLKSISAGVIFREYSGVKKQLWGGEFWEDGYFVRTGGDKVTAEVIRKYIEYHHDHEKTPKQLKLF